MKTNLFISLGIGLLCSLHSSAQYNVTNLDLEAQHADVSLIDWDHDGDLDLLISGESNGPINMKAYLNDGAGNYTVTEVPFIPVTRGSFSWNDVNMDGNPDLLENGFGGEGIYTGVFTSDGSGAFTENTTLALPQMSPSSGFADFNNDGFIDIYVFGNNDQGTSKIMINNKAGGFVDSHALDAFDFHTDPDVTVADYDNDKDLDLLVSSKGPMPDFAKFLWIYKNDNGVFTETQVDSRGAALGYGSSSWGDYDGDGYLDVLIYGDANNNAYWSYKLYKNNAGAGFALIDSFHYGQFSTGDGGKFLDWDNDGDLDLVVTGWTGSRQATALYLNTGGVFTEDPTNATIPGFSESSIEIGDVDNDSDLDLILTGFSGHDFDGAGTVGPYNKNVSILVRNPSTNMNLPPSGPANLKVTGSQETLTFSWDAATDATTPAGSLSYNMYLVNDNGKTFIYSLADTSTGALILPKMGNVQLNTGWILHDLPAGNYRWGVQAIDNSFASSLFTKGTFTVNANGTLPVSISAYNVKSDRNKAKIEWTTGLEQNNDHFEVYRSDDGKNFVKIETVKSKGANGNSYTIYDNNPSSGLNYYRLLQFDVNGQSKDHGIRTVTFNIPNNASVIAFPNPAYAEVGIRLSNYKGKQLSVIMSDMMGKLIHSEKMTINNSQGYYTLKLKSRPVSGQYIINVSGENFRESLKVLIK